MNREPAVVVRRLGRRTYGPVLEAMRAFTRARTRETPDEFWIVEHEPVFTQGQAGRAEHLLDPGGTPVVQTDRGGQVTWHGPGQLVVYPLLDLHRAGLGVRVVVRAIEDAVIDVLAAHGVAATARPDAPGVYVDGAKIAALGLRVSRGRTYHGLSLNLTCDLEPFRRIDPCGMAGLAVTRLADLGVHEAFDTVADRVVEGLRARLGLNGTGTARAAGLPPELEASERTPTPPTREQRA